MNESAFGGRFALRPPPFLGGSPPERVLFGRNRLIFCESEVGNP